MTLALFPSAFGLALGFGLGLVHFASLRRVTALYLEGAAPARALGLQLLRLALLAGALVFLAQLGTAPLLAGACGVLIARAIVLSRARREA